MGHWRKKEESQKYLEINEKKGIMSQNLWDTAKEVLGGKFIAYLRKKKKISNKQLKLTLNGTWKRRNKSQSKCLIMNLVFRAFVFNVIFDLYDVHLLFCQWFYVSLLFLFSFLLFFLSLDSSIFKIVVYLPPPFCLAYWLLIFVFLFQTIGCHRVYGIYISDLSLSNF